MLLGGEEGSAQSSPLTGARALGSQEKEMNAQQEEGVPTEPSGEDAYGTLVALLWRCSNP